MRWWVRFTYGQVVMSLANFCLLAITASQPIARAIGVEPKVVAMALPPLAVVGMVAIGTVMDWCRYAQRLDRESVARSTGWDRLWARLDKIEAAIEKKGVGR